jgi:hypothetical protein
VDVVAPAGSPQLGAPFALQELAAEHATLWDVLEWAVAVFVAASTFCEGSAQRLG